MKGPRRSNLVYPTMAVAHEGLASLAVDLHEVGDLLALTISPFWWIDDNTRFAQERTQMNISYPNF